MHLLIVSGKGGTGKTTLAAALAQLSGSEMVIDCDVEASNLHLLLAENDLQRQQFSGAKIAKEQANDCRRCGLCTDYCRFGAIHDGQVDSNLCEGCGVCVYVCPENHLVLTDMVTGTCVLSQTSNGLMSRAEMEPGAEGSGKLVTEIRRQGRLAVPNAQLTLLDGPPGLGCAVIASMTGCQLALVVAEASLAGLSDARRILALLNQMEVEALLCINRYDINLEASLEIEQLCDQQQIPLVGKIPHDPMVRRAQRHNQSVLEYPTSPAAQAIFALWKELRSRIAKQGGSIE